VSEEVNRKLPARNTMVQLLTLYADYERLNAHVTDGQTDDSMMPRCCVQYDRLKTNDKNRRKRNQ